MHAKKWLEDLEKEKIIEECQLKLLCEDVKELLIEESNVTPVAAPVIICGDVHGQFFDVLELFKQGGAIPDKSYIFIGDFVDRGYNSVETFEYLLCLKLLHPDRITLLRGNHESRQVTSVYGLYDEISRKYGNANPWRYFCDLFDYLPLAALVEGRILCVHGGLSPDIRTVDQIRIIDRKQEIPHEGPFSDLMWSDPEDIEAWQMSPRGAGWFFGARVVSEFNQLNDLDLVCRAHQLVQEGLFKLNYHLKGYKYWFEKKLVTVWSAPNYCYRCGNEASILELNENLEQKFTIFKEVERSAKSIDPKKVLPYFL